MLAKRFVVRALVRFPPEGGTTNPLDKSLAAMRSSNAEVQDI